MKSPRKPKPAPHGSLPSKGEYSVSVKMGSLSKKLAAKLSSPYAQGHVIIQTKRPKKFRAFAAPDSARKSLLDIPLLVIANDDVCLPAQSQDTGAYLGYERKVFDVKHLERERSGVRVLSPIRVHGDRRVKVAPASETDKQPVRQYSASEFGQPLDAEPESPKRVNTSGLASYGVLHIEALYRSRAK